jgi:hypothetical protein
VCIHVRRRTIKPIALFLTLADELYGPITTLRSNTNQVIKHIPWTAFKMVEQDWVRVVDARDILHVIDSDFSASITIYKS